MIQLFAQGIRILHDLDWTFVLGCIMLAKMLGIPIVAMFWDFD